MGLADPVIEVKLTPNRPDCTGVRGIARDLAAAGLGKLKPERKVARRRRRASIVRSKSSWSFRRGRARRLPLLRRPLHPRREQRRLARPGCSSASRPSACAPSTRWSTSPTTSASTAAGRCTSMTPTSSSGAIRARLGRKGETFAGLDGKTHAVDETMCVIADDRAVLGFGGIIGGEDTGCTHDDQERADRVRLFRPAAHGRHRPQDRHQSAMRATASSAASIRPSSCPASISPPPDAGGGRRHAVQAQVAGAPPESQDRHRLLDSRWSRSSAASSCEEKQIRATLEALGFAIDGKGATRQGDGAELAARHPRRRRSRRGGRAHRRPRQGALGADAAPRPAWRAPC